MTVKWFTSNSSICCLVAIVSRREIDLSCHFCQETEIGIERESPSMSPCEICHATIWISLCMREKSICTKWEMRKCEWTFTFHMSVTDTFSPTWMREPFEVNQKKELSISALVCWFLECWKCITDDWFIDIIHAGVVCQVVEFLFFLATFLSIMCYLSHISSMWKYTLETIPLLPSSHTDFLVMSVKALLSPRKILSRVLES